MALPEANCQHLSELILRMGPLCKPSQEDGRFERDGAIEMIRLPFILLFLSMGLCCASAQSGHLGSAAGAKSMLARCFPLLPKTTR